MFVLLGTDVIVAKAYRVYHIAGGVLNIWMKGPHVYRIVDLYTRTHVGLFVTPVHRVIWNIVKIKTYHNLKTKGISFVRL